MAHVDFGLNELLKKLDAVGDPAIIRKVKAKTLNTLGMRAIDRAKRLTPVRTGHLRRSWKMELVGENAVAIENPLHYAPHVNYGHRQNVGQFVPTLGKRLKAPYVAGAHMLEKAMAQTEKELKRELAKAMQEILGRFI